MQTPVDFVGGLTFGAHIDDILSGWVRQTYGRLAEQLFESEPVATPVAFRFRNLPFFNARASFAEGTGIVEINRGLIDWSAGFFGRIDGTGTPAAEGDLKPHHDFVAGLRDFIPHCDPPVRFGPGSAGVDLSPQVRTGVRHFLENVLFHEVSHIVLGHCSYANAASGSGSLWLSDLPEPGGAPGEISPENRIYFELEADRMSGTFAALHAASGNGGSAAIAGSASGHIAAFMIFAVAVHASMTVDDYKRTYPSPFCRLTAYSDGLRRGSVRFKGNEKKILGEDVIQESFGAALDYMSTASEHHAGLLAMNDFLDPALRDACIEEYSRINNGCRPPALGSFRLVSMDEN